MRRFLKSERGDAGMYFLAAIMVWLTLTLSVAYAVIHTVEIGRAQMSADLQIAMRQAASQLNTVGAVQGTQGVTPTEASALVASDLAQIAPATWHYSITGVQVFDQSQAGAPAPSGVPGGVIPGAGIYAAVDLIWPLPVPLVNHVTINIPEWMSANVFVQPTQTWNGG